MLARPRFGMCKQGFTDTETLLRRRDGKIGDMAVAAPGEKIRGALQVHETDSLAIGILGDKQIAVRWLILQMFQQIVANAFNAFVPSPPRRQRKIRKARHKCKNEIVVVFSETDQQSGLGHQAAALRKSRHLFYTLRGVHERAAAAAVETIGAIVDAKRAFRAFADDGWQAYCIAHHMSESAYDISYLLEAELAKFSSPAPAAASMEAPASAMAMAEQDAASTQAATARELLALDAAHEELIRQYMQISSFKA